MTGPPATRPAQADPGGSQFGAPNSGRRPVDDALRAIGALFEPGDVIEIRALEVDRKPDRRGVTYSGYFDFDNQDAISRAVAQLNSRAEGVYVILNRIDPALLARANNRLQA